MKKFLAVLFLAVCLLTFIGCSGGSVSAPDPVINDHLGDAYWKVGRRLEATFQWNHARDLNPEPEDLPKILKKIELGGLPEDKPAQAESRIEPPALPEVKTPEVKAPEIKPNGG